MSRRLLCAILTALAILAQAAFPSRPVAGEASALTLLVFHRPPYYMLDNGKAAGGFLLSVALAVFELAGFPVTIREMPPSRIMATLADTKARLCAVGWIKTPERQAFARFSQPIYRNQPMAVAIRTDRPIPTEPPPSIKALLGAGLTWGLREGFSYGPPFDQAFLAVSPDRIKRFSDTPHMVGLLAQGRLDAMPIDPEELAWIIGSHPRLGPRIRLVPLADAPPGHDRCIICSQAVPPEDMARLDAAIVSFMATDTYRALTGCSLPQ
ncbi:substrate-binding periplasmic protein [Solidesulfovibrio sp.]